MAENNKNNQIIVPFLKWAGGKRWLVSSSPEIFPTKFNRYIEPFLGSGAVFFHLQPSKALLSDLNPELIKTYKAIKSDWRKVESALRLHHKKHSTKYYYAIRDSHPTEIYKLAARFIYLNRTCWNGLYRVNLDGNFNVPIGSKVDVLLESDAFEATSKILKGATLKHSDFESIIDTADSNDFVFIDPPYTVKHNYNGFIKYNEKLFSWEDQIRLKGAISRAAKRGAQVLLTNADHRSVRELYSDFSFSSVSRASVLAANAKRRGTVSELFIRNY